MKSWQKFEENALDYLNKYFNQWAEFTLIGGSDSTYSDIKVKAQKKEFYIETKLKKAQTGQFVLYPIMETRKFIYSEKNKSVFNDITTDIIEYMNQYFEEFLYAGTSGKEIFLEQEVLASWIKQNYKQKQVSFLLVDMEYLLIPLDKLEIFFEIKAMYRVKKSGSTHLPKQYYSLIKNNSPSNEMPIIEDGRFFIKSNENIDKKQFIIENKTFMYSKSNDNLYEVRKLSDTYNANVIFSLNLKKCYPKGVDYDTFVEFLLS